MTAAVSFIDIDSVPPIEIFPGVRIRTPYGKNLMLSYVEIEEGAVVSFHHHPHEQGGVVLSGRLELTIGGETRTLGAGEMYIIPPDTPHRAAAAGGRTVVMDVFSPVREDYAARTEQAAKSGRDGAAAEQRR
jgi:quercetin dioxygenase-like cupin family protein